MKTKTDNNNTNSLVNAACEPNAEVALPAGSSEPRTTLPEIQLAYTGKGWAAVQLAPPELVERGAVVPKRIAIGLNTQDYPAAMRKAVEELSPYREQYRQVARGELKGFTGRDEFSTDPWPLQEVWSVIYRAGISQPVDPVELSQDSRVDGPTIRQMMEVFRVLTAERRGGNRGPDKASEWTAAKLWYDAHVAAAWARKRQQADAELQETLRLAATSDAERAAERWAEGSTPGLFATPLSVLAAREKEASRNGR